MKTILITLLLSVQAMNAFSDNDQGCQGKVTNNRKHGFWRCFYKNGSLQQEGTYIFGARDGYWKIYHDNGILAAEGKYSKDAEVGNWKIYDDNGKLLFTANRDDQKDLK